MATGTVKWFSDDKGFRLSTPDDSGKDLFVHHSAIHGNGFNSLTESAKGGYDAEQGPKSPAAAKVPSAVKLDCLAKRRDIAACALALFSPSRRVSPTAWVSDRAAGEGAAPRALAGSARIPRVWFRRMGS